MTKRHAPNACKIYLPQNVVEAATERVAWTFDEFDTISVSVSGGKDSTVLFELVWREAQRRNRRFQCFFLDQEAEYKATINVVDEMMRRDLVDPLWLQVPCRMTNATSYEEEWLYAWEPGMEKYFIHPYSDLSIKDPLPVDRFYKIMNWADRQIGSGAVSLVGLRSEESLNRFGAVTRHPAIPGVNWSSKAAGGSVKLYPIYDWTFEDVWTFIGNEGLQYNPIYDWMYAKGMRLKEMRVSNLIHEKAFRSLATLQEFEPDTYERIVARLKGIPTAARYGREQMLFDVRKLPPNFDSWRQYRDFLLSTYPVGHRLDAFLARFADQPENEGTYRQQVRQLMINDWENNVPVAKVKEKGESLRRWAEIL